MNLKQILSWSLKHWWWFVVSVVVCLLLGGVRYVTKTPKFNVRATLMLRQISDKGKGAEEMLQLMGLQGNKVAGDEVRVLTSRDLLGRVVDKLDLTTTYVKKSHGKWEEQFPEHELTASIQLTKPQNVVVDVVVKENQYRVKIKRFMKFTERYTVTDLSQPIHTTIGDLQLAMPDSVVKGHYRASIMPRLATIDWISRQIEVNRLGRESNVITLSTQTASPRRMVAIINTLLSLYNYESTTDKNLLAVQTEQFLANRIAIVEQELNNAEIAVEAYKRRQQIANLSKTADNYQQMGEKFEQQVALVDADIRVVNYLLEQIEKPENKYTMIPCNLTNGSELLSQLIGDYNSHIMRHQMLLQTATEQNAAVIRENELLILKRQSVKEGMLQERQTLQLKRQSVLDQQNQYLDRLSSLPETERHYVEMCREKETKEKQYIYLIEKREENAMLLSSETVPARIVESAQQEATPVSPKFLVMFAQSLFFGLLLPLLVYFFGLFRKEYL